MEAYRTIGGSAEAEFTERKSRFIGAVFPVGTEQEARDFIAGVSRLHRDANHNVFAYRLRSGGERCSDNGEPQGTAGLPCMDVLQREELVDLCVVVTRYFGGVLLGTGGLVRAYGHTAKLAVDAGRIVTMCPCVRAKASCDYSFYGKLAYILPEYGVTEEDTQFAGDVTLSMRMRAEAFAPFAAAVTELSNGRVEVRQTEEFFGAL